MEPKYIIIIASILIFVSIILFAILLMKLNHSPRNDFKFNNRPPENLGLVNINIYLTVVTLLNNAIEEQFINQIKERIIQKNNINDNYFEWSLLELKRFFVLTKILKNVSLYSKFADEIWHEMILSTKEYCKFSNIYNGEYIHHTPKNPNDPLNVYYFAYTDERAFFDWIYSKIFKILPENEYLNKKFFKTPLSKEFIKWIDQSSINDIRDRYFCSNQDSYLITQLIVELKEDIRKMTALNLNTIKQRQKENDYVLPFLYFSYFYQGEFNDMMWHDSETGIADSNDSGGSCGSASCGGGD
ncbi:hypothetical protein B4U37_21620 (plasmid) [Sutcliffiella horikoshii]|uniref:Uncharacterized protein n=1 Tax=Sutcliffiella horikoshii TaxID=79883 RepID=A0ABM6KQX5_9BACI|nr:hypothetical protein [Sutcliffiella horikoshii]ART78713.1 hypothetical protein B4U37_21620 [Sutcliffiella horikoshii]